ncbi:MAG: hypothetical protein KDD66_07145 [Bdellovibrionales bacterium]|nr:hypothetical protein [Bdellovibrionales bacterium]
MADIVDESGSSDSSSSAGGRDGASFLDDHSQHGIISARGTEDGLVIRIDGRSEWPEILQELTVFLGERRRFLEGGEVAIEWLDRLPTKDQSETLEHLLRDDYNIEVVGRRRRAPRLIANPGGKLDSGINSSHPTEAVSLFEKIEKSRYVSKSASESGIDEIALTLAESEIDGSPLSQDQLRRITDLLGEDTFLEEDANARILYGTLRSGQRVETPFSLVVIGDVNPGADLIAGGDIIILGSLRGTAHASAYDDDCEGRVIIAMQMQPMQLRIGSVISRGSDESGRGAEIARIEDRRIIVESFHPRGLNTKRGGARR